MTKYFRVVLSITFTKECRYYKEISTGTGEIPNLAKYSVDTGTWVTTSYTDMVDFKFYNQAITISSEEVTYEEMLKDIFLRELTT